MAETKQVLAYFLEWVGKGVNPINGCAILGGGRLDWHRVLFPSEIDGQPHIFEVHGSAGNSSYEIAARILKIDKPKAAFIKWEQIDNYTWRGDGYSIEWRGDLGWACYFEANRLGDGFLELVADAFSLCQDDKQKRFEKLGGYS